MKREFQNIEALLKNGFVINEYPKTQALINELVAVKREGYFTKAQFLKMCCWKSPRPKRFYESNSEQTIQSVSEQVFAINDEKRKIELLTGLSGVGIPVASAILMLTNPKNYGVIDIRVWQLLYLYNVVSTKPSGQNFAYQNWYDYLTTLRHLAKAFDVDVRMVERTLFEYHRGAQTGRLYE